MQTEKEIRENLTDAGCSESCIRSFLDYRDKGDIREADRILEAQRKELLEELHKSQKRIDCLDYLRWCMDQEQS